MKKYPATETDGRVITYGKGRGKCKVAVFPDGIFIELIDQAALFAIVDGSAVAFPDEGGVWISEKHIPDVLPSVAKEWPKLRAKILEDIEKL